MIRHFTQHNFQTLIFFKNHLIHCLPPGIPPTNLPISLPLIVSTLPLIVLIIPLIVLIIPQINSITSHINPTLPHLPTSKTSKLHIFTR